MIYLKPFDVPALSFAKLQIDWRFKCTPYSFGGDLNPTNEHMP